MYDFQVLSIGGERDLRKRINLDRIIQSARPIPLSLGTEHTPERAKLPYGVMIKSRDLSNLQERRCLPEEFCK